MDGTEIVCGNMKQANNRPVVSLRVLRDAFWVRLALFADMVCEVVALRTLRQLRSS